MLLLPLQWLWEIQERDQVLEQAKETAQRLKKKLLNAGCGRWYQPAILASDVNVDIAPRPGMRNFVQTSVEDLSMFGDKEFGAVFCAHVLEHVDNPQKALSELERVSDYQFIITPSPLFLSTWLHPQHRRVFKDTRGERVLLELSLKPILR